MGEKKRKPRTRLSRGVFVSLCLAVVFALVVGTGLSRAPFAEQVSADNISNTNLPESVVETNIPEEDQDESLEIVNDADYGDYEKGKVLILVDETTDIAQLDSALASNDLVQTKSVSDQDRSVGFVQVRIDDDASMKQVLTELKNAGIRAQPNYVYYPAEDVYPAEDASDEAPNASDEVAEVDLNSESAAKDSTANELTGDAEEELSCAADPVEVNDPGTSSQWALNSLDVYRAWGIAKCKDDDSLQPKVSVAVIDTGCLVTHEDLVGNVRATYNSSTEQTGVDQVEDQNGHGTHVAGIVAADANNGLGVAGTSYDAGLVIIKATTDDAGKNFTTETLAQAYTWLLSTSTSGQTNAQFNSVRVVNMSVGGKDSIDEDDVLYQKITEAKNEGILTVCAAGNAMTGAVPPYECIPGDYKDCFTVINLEKVSGTDPNDSSGSTFVQRASGSNYNADGTNTKNISAPGTSIYSTLTSGDYGNKSGTSMASPAVAGVAALLFAYDSSLSPDEAQTLLEQTATDIGDEGWDEETGYGEVDAYHALQVLDAEISIEDIKFGETAVLKLVCSDGSTLPISEYAWTSSNPNIVSIDSETGEIVGKHAGSATLEGTSKAIPSRTVSREVSVAQIDLSNSMIEGVGDLSYTGQPCKFSDIKVMLDSGNTLVQGTDYSVAYYNNVEPGTATVTVTGKGNYTGSVSMNFEIKDTAEPLDPSDPNEGEKDPEPTTISISEASVSVSDQTYTGSALTPKPTVKYDSKTLVEGTDYTLSYSNNTNVGTAKIVITGKGNYTGTKTVTFKINASAGKPLSSATVSSSHMTKNATGKALSPSISVKYGSTTLRAGTDYAITYNGSTSAPTKAGNYTVKIVGKGSYSGEKTVGTFRLVQGPNTGSSQVRISSLSNSNYVLDAAGSTPKIGANISIWTDNGGNNQKWYLSLGSDGYYTIKSASNQSFIIDAANATPKQGSNASIWTSHGGNNQKWIIEPSTNGSYIIRNVANQNLVLDASGSSPKKGANVSVWTSHGGNNQKWKITTVTTPSFDSTKTYEITSLSNSNYTLDAAGSTPKKGANVSIWTKHGGKNQRWYLVPDGKGYYTIKSASNPNYVLDAAGSTPKKGSNVSIWTSHGGNNQKWKIEQLANGSYLIRSAANPNYVLDASGSSPKKGANVSIWASHGGSNQKWKITAM